MSFAPWIRNLFTRPAPRRRAHPARLGCDALENRTVPTVWTVTNGLDSGSGSLREALGLSADGDTIQFALPSPDTEINLTSGQLNVTTSVSIVGVGADDLIIQRSPYVPAPDLPEFRVFWVAPGETVSMSDLTIRGGVFGATDPDDPDEAVISHGYGAGIYNALHAHLTLSDTLVKNNAISTTNLMNQSGAQAYGGGLYNDGTAVISDSTIANNVAGAGGTYETIGGSYSAAGAGVYNEGTLSLTGVVVRENYIAGSIYAPQYRGDTHAAGFGGGIYSAFESSTTVARSVVESNMATGGSRVHDGGGSGGGGIWVGGFVVVTDSLIDNNYAHYGTKLQHYGTAAGGGVFVYRDPVNENYVGHFEAERVTISNNHAYSDRSRGAGVAAAGEAVIRNSTISTNDASWNPVPPNKMWDTFGGGVAVLGKGELDLSFSTVVDNVAITYLPSAKIPGSGIGQGGGVYVDLDATANFDSNIVARNKAGWGFAPFGEQPDVVDQDVSVAVLGTEHGDLWSAGYNLIGTDVGSAAYWVASDQTGTTGALLDPVLGPLQVNGGPWIGYTFPPSAEPPPYRRQTYTHEVLAWSPALRAGNPATSPATDERGVERETWRPNVGAYEATLDAFRVEMVYPGDVYAGSPFSIRVTAIDPYGKTVYVYEGAVTFTSSDTSAYLPPNYTYILTDEGTHVFDGVILNQTGTQTITVTDPLDPADGSGTFNVVGGGGGSPPPPPPPGGGGGEPPPFPPPGGGGPPRP